MSEPFLPYTKQSITEDDIASVTRALNQEWITRGPEVEAFEEELAKYCGAEHAITFNSGSSALHAAYWAADVNSADRILTTPNTYIATVGPAVQLGAQPLMVDIDRDSGNLKLSEIETYLDYQPTRGKLIIAPVHFAGIAVDVPTLAKLPLPMETVIIEDAAHALGSHYPNGEKVGSCHWSDMAVFSFHPAKQITTGEGGAVTTNNPTYAARLRQFRNNGIVKKENPQAPWLYSVEALTGNYHLTELQAALGRSQLKQLDGWIAKRRDLVAHYRNKLGSQAHLFSAAHDPLTAYHLFVVQIDFEKIGKTRAEVMQHLKNVNIGTQVHYIPLYEHPIFIEHFADQRELFEEMNTYYAQALSLPLFPAMTTQDIDRVCQALLSLL